MSLPMSLPMYLPYGPLADAVLVLHAAVVAFVVFGLAAIVAGGRRRWGWTAGREFRLAHGAAIAFVVTESWLGLVCPLTALESWLRARAGSPAAYAGGFVEHGLQRLLYWDAPAWAFTLAYSLFGLAVAAAWWRYPPRPGPPRR